MGIGCCLGGAGMVDEARGGRGVERVFRLDEGPGAHIGRWEESSVLYRATSRHGAPSAGRECVSGRNRVVMQVGMVSLRRSQSGSRQAWS